MQASISAFNKFGRPQLPKPGCDRYGLEKSGEFNTILPGGKWICVPTWWEISCCFETGRRGFGRWMGELSYACPISFDLTVKVASKHTLCMQDKSVLGGRECIARYLTGASSCSITECAPMVNGKCFYARREYMVDSFLMFVWGVLCSSSSSGSMSR